MAARHRPASQADLALWWRVEAPDLAGALGLLPRFVADRTTAIEVREVEIP
jgi:hypothetical protein